MAHYRQLRFKACLVLLAWVPIAALFGADPCSAEPSMVRVDGQRLSVKAVHTPLETLLAQIARQSDIEIFLQGRAAHPVSMDLHRVPMESGIKRLIAGHNHAFTYRRGANSDIAIKQLYVYFMNGDGDMKRMALPGVVPPARPENAVGEDGIVTHGQAPDRRDRLVTMQAIDPLMRINEARAPFLPEGFHRPGVHPAGADGRSSLPADGTSFPPMR